MSTEKTPQADSQAVEEGSKISGTVIPDKEDGDKSSGKSRKSKSEDKKLARKNEKISDLEKKIVKLEEDKADFKDQLLRKQADFDNFRKRMFREKEEAIKYANSNLLQDIVGTIDDFDRALQSAAQSKDFDALHSGIELIEKQLTSMLERKYGLKRFESIGEEFDPDKHEALAMEESEDHDIQTVLEDYLKGFMLHDRVLRHAKVKIASPVQTKDETNTIPEEPEA